MSDAVI